MRRCSRLIHGDGDYSSPAPSGWQKAHIWGQLKNRTDQLTTTARFAESLPYPNLLATLLDMTDKPYCFSQDYELAVTVSSISGPKDLMRMAYGTKEPRCVIERAMKEVVLEGGIWEDAITFYPVSAIIGYRLVEMDGLSKARLITIRERIRKEATPGRNKS